MSISIQRAACLLASGLLLSTATTVMAQNQATAPSNGLELPDLQQINRPVSETQHVDLNGRREPSFVLKEPDGTQVTEYRDRGKSVDIQVKSGLGTSYQMSKPEDPSPKIRDQETTRVPSVNLLKF